MTATHHRHTLDPPTVELPAIPRAEPRPIPGVVRALKKPVQRDAIQFTGTNWDDVARFAEGNFRPVTPTPFTDPDIADWAADWAGRGMGLGRPRAEPWFVAEVYDRVHGDWIGIEVGFWVLKVLDSPHGVHFYPMSAEQFAERMEILEGEKKS